MAAGERGAAPTPPRPLPRYNGGVNRSPLPELPRKLPARIAVIAALIVGGVVAVLVPVFFAVMLWGMLHGAPPPRP